MADDLVAGRVLDRGLALDDRNQRVARIADLEEDLALGGGALLADLSEGLQLRLGENRTDVGGHGKRVASVTSHP